MASFPLIDSTGKICQIDPAPFPVAPPFTWGSDISALVPGPQFGWAASETGGVWTFTAPPAPPAPSAAQIAAAAYMAFTSGGLTVTSTGTPALSGVYPIDPASQADIATEAQFISTFSEFTNGATTNLQWVLTNGALVTFPTTAEFLAFAKQAGQIVAAAKLAAAQGASMPAATATIP